MSSAIREPALIRNRHPMWRMTMIKFKQLAAITILSVIASPALAQAGVQEPGVHVKNLRSADLGIGSPQPSQINRYGRQVNGVACAGRPPTTARGRYSLIGGLAKGFVEPRSGKIRR